MVILGRVQKPDAAKTERETGRRRQTGGFEERERQDIAGRQGRTDTTRCKTGDKERWAVRQTCGQGETDRWDAGRQIKRSPSDRQSRD